MKTIAENTGVTIGVVVSLLGGSMFFTKSYFMAEEAVRAAEVNQADLKTIVSDISKIKEDLSAIKQQLKEDK